MWGRHDAEPQGTQEREGGSLPQDFPARAAAAAVRQMAVVGCDMGRGRGWVPRLRLASAGGAGLRESQGRWVLGPRVFLYRYCRVTLERASQRRLRGRGQFCLNVVCPLRGLPPGRVAVPSPEAAHVSLDSPKPRTLGTRHLSGLGLRSCRGLCSHSLLG